MNIKLSEDGSRSYSGIEILNAFMRASSFLESDRITYFGSEENLEVQYKPGSVKQEILACGARVRPYRWAREMVFFGSKQWKFKNGYDFILDKLLMKREHRMVNIRCVQNSYGTEVAPGHSDFPKVRSNFEAFLARFFEELKKLPEAPAVEPT
jgi:hypothetical protein